MVNQVSKSVQKWCQKGVEKCPKPGTVSGQDMPKTVGNGGHKAGPGTAGPGTVGPGTVVQCSPVPGHPVPGTTRTRYPRTPAPSTRDPTTPAGMSVYSACPSAG